MAWLDWIIIFLIAIVMLAFFYFIIFIIYKTTGMRLQRRYKPEIDTGREPDLFRKTKNGRVGEIKSDIAG